MSLNNAVSTTTTNLLKAEKKYNTNYDPKQPLTLDLIVAEEIKALRLQKNIKQKELADKIGVTFQQYQKYESGKNRLTLGRLFTICKALEVPISFFIK